MILSKQDDCCKNCSKFNVEDREMDILFKVMDNENDVTLTDGKGKILRVSDSYEKHYGVNKQEIEGKTVFEMETEGIFKPSVTVVVLKEKRKVTIMQWNRIGQKILTTGVPIFNDKNEIRYVVSFNSIDIVDLRTTQEKYVKLKEMMMQYNIEINELRIQNMQNKGMIIKSK